MKVLQINNYHWVRGGSDRYYLDLSKALSESKVEVFCVSTKHPNNVDSPALAWPISGFDIERPSKRDAMHMVYARTVANSIERCIRYYRPQLAHLHIYEGQFSPSILHVLKENKIPIIQTVHDYKPVCPVGTLWDGSQICTRCFRGHFYRCAIHRCNRKKFGRSLLNSVQNYAAWALGVLDKIDEFIAVSERQRTLLVAGGVPASRVSVVHNFTFNELRGPERSDEKTVGCCRIVFIGRLETIKGIWTLVEVASNCRNVSFELIGTGEEAQAIEEAVRSRGLSNVRMTGRKEGQALRAAIAAATAVVIPSLCEETFGLAVLEAWSQRVPVIASDIGGMSELVRDESDGLLVMPGDVEELASAIKKLENMPSKAKIMGKNGLARVLDEFGVNRHITKILEIYERHV